MKQGWLRFVFIHSILSFNSPWNTHAFVFSNQNRVPLYHPKVTEISWSSSTQLSLWGRQPKEAQQLNDKSTSLKTDSTTKQEDRMIQIGSNIGSGSYGTVHLCQFVNNDNDDGDPTIMIAKRAWTEQDLHLRIKKEVSAEYREEKAERCAYYLNVEKHCIQKIQNVSQKEQSQTPQIIGTFLDKDGYTWLVFELIEKSSSTSTSTSTSTSISTKQQTLTTTTPAVTLADAIRSDWSDQHDNTHSRYHHLHVLQQELGLSFQDNDMTTNFEYTLDKVFMSLLSVMKQIHSQNIVHRDIKPSNLLCDPKSKQFVLIDFGSAADMDPPSNPSLSTSLLSGLGIDSSGGRIGLGGSIDGKTASTNNQNIVAVSPIYAAPETFIQIHNNPLHFDVFSSALIFCQLLFNLLDERSDAAFHQQIKYANYDLDLWLKEELFQSKLRFVGVEEALTYLGQRPGLWNLLKQMLQKDPQQRISSKQAYAKFTDILENLDNDTIHLELSSDFDDGSFFKAILESMETCDIFPPEWHDLDQTKTNVATERITETNQTLLTEDDDHMTTMKIPRPLHYIATFNRAKPLGLILAEVDDDHDDDHDHDHDHDHDDDAPIMDAEKQLAWEIATKYAKEGEVFIRDIVEGGQAASIEFKGIFEIGDRLRGVGDLPFVSGGFENVVTMLSQQPKSAKSVKLHFDRKPVIPTTPKTITDTHLVNIVGQGAWSVKGRRKAQEDAFVLHEINDSNGNAILMAGVFDGHGGTAASTTVAQLLPSLFSAELAATSTNLEDALISSWETTCDTYQVGCSERGHCVADYDPVEGIIMADVGSEDLVAGTTASAAVLSADKDGTDEVIIMNCGDSRTLLFGRSKNIQDDGNKQSQSSSVVHFCTRDHSPRDELEGKRLQKGREEGFDYSLPQCSLSRWWLTIGDYQYAISRSLEGTFATSKGIVPDADISKIDLTTMLAERELSILSIVSDGIFEVMDNEEIGRDLISMRELGINAGDAAKQICGIALDKGTYDNVSAIVIYLE